MLFLSEVPATSRDAHWALGISYAAVAILFVFGAYVLIRSMLTSSGKLELAPRHIQEATSILTWISATSPLIMLFGTFFDIYVQIYEAGVRGPFDPVFPYLRLMEFLGHLGTGVLVSLFALFGVGLIFLKRLRNPSRECQAE